jgi:hypothetical protein
MSRALWKITAFVSRALNFIAFSCSIAFHAHLLDGAETGGPHFQGCVASW